jgi:dienelactone hydrolase
MNRTSQPVPRYQDIPWRSILGITLLVMAITGLRAAASVDALWRGFDPSALPLDARVLREEAGDGFVIRTVQFTSEIVDGFTVRAVAYYGFPAGGRNLPAVLHIHGGGQNATRAYVEHWVRRGFTALSLNWGGRRLEGREASAKTDWGPLPFNQDGRDRESLYRTSPDARANSWYHWVVVCRRAITFLEQQSEVDRTRVGAFGISMGGRLMWLVAGTDPRLRCAVSVFGSALNGERVNGLPGSEYEPEAADSTWRATLDAIAYAPRITMPFLYLSAANDFYGRMDNADRTLRRIPGRERWQYFAPHFNHHAGSAAAPALAQWMERWLRDGPAWPYSPALSLQLDRRITATVKPDHAANVESVSIHYSTGLFPQSRFWRTVPAKKQGGTWNAELPMTEIDQGVHAYANVRYRSALVLSTGLETMSSDRLHQAGVAVTDPPARLIDDFHDGATDWFFPQAGAQVLLSEREHFPRGANPERRTAISAHAPAPGEWRFFTRKLADPKWRGPPGAGLRLELRAEEANTVTVVVVENDRYEPRPARAYVASARLDGGRWESVLLPLKEFREVYDGTPLMNWAAVKQLGIIGRFRFTGGLVGGAQRDMGTWQGPSPELGRVEWVSPP